MTTGGNTTYNQPLRSLLPEELRQAALCWYPFASGARALYLGNDPQAHLPRLREFYDEVDVELRAGCAYDCIAVSDWTGSQADLDDALTRFAEALAPDGVLLLGFRNRIGLKYLCGGIDDVVAEPFQSLHGTAGDTGLFSRAEMEDALGRSPFSQSRFHALMPDAGFAQAVYTDDHVPESGIRDRVFPYDPYGSPFAMPESRLYDAVVAKGMLMRLANHFVVECRLADAAPPARQVVFAALSADRGEKDSFATVAFSDETVLKAPLHPAGRTSLQAIYDNGEMLRERGVHVIEQTMTPEGIEMPFVHDEPMLAHLDHQLRRGSREFLDVFHQIEKDVWKSSSPAELDDGEARRVWGVSAGELGPILERGFIDMIPYNSFWADDGITYYDQEFTVERCPIAYILFRALRYTYIHLPRTEEIVPLEEAKREFGLDGLWEAFMERENAFVGKNRNWRRYHQIYEWANIRDDDDRAKRAGLIASRSFRIDEENPLEAPSGKRYGTGLLMGVFDLFHVGHLRLIQRAKAECEFLRVGVLSDELVMEFKSITPVIPLAERMDIIAAIEGVDEVVPIEGNPSRVMEWHKRPFDCFFSGDDYKGDSYWEWERSELQKLGADIRFFPYTQQQSSSKIRKQLG